VLWWPNKLGAWACPPPNNDPAGRLPNSDWPPARGDPNVCRAYGWYAGSCTTPPRKPESNPRLPTPPTTRPAGLGENPPANGRSPVVCRWGENKEGFARGLRGIPVGRTGDRGGSMVGRLPNSEGTLCCRGKRDGRGKFCSWRRPPNSGTNGRSRAFTDWLRCLDRISVLSKGARARVSGITPLAE